MGRVPGYGVMAILRGSKMVGESIDIVVAYQRLSPDDIENRESWTGAKHHLTRTDQWIGEERVERVGARRELGFAVLLTCVCTLMAAYQGSAEMS